MGFWNGLAQAAKEAKDKDFTREMFLKESAEKRRTMLLGALAKRRETSSEAESFAPDLAWVQSRVAGAEGSEEFLASISKNPALAGRIRKEIEEAEKANADKDYNVSITGENLIQAFPIIGENIDNKDAMTIFRSTGDPYKAILSGDVMDDEFFGNTMDEITRSAPAPTSTVDPNFSKLGIPDAARYEKQNTLFNTKVLALASQDINRLVEAGDETGASLIKDMMDNFGKEGFEQVTAKLYAMYAEPAFQSMATSDVPFYDNVERNPTILEARELFRIYNEPAEAATAKTASENAEKIAILKENDLSLESATRPTFNSASEAKANHPEGDVWIKRNNELFYVPPVMDAPTQGGTEDNISFFLRGGKGSKWNEALGADGEGTPGGLGFFLRGGEGSKWNEFLANQPGVPDTPRGVSLGTSRASIDPDKIDEYLKSIGE